MRKMLILFVGLLSLTTAVRADSCIESPDLTARDRQDIRTLTRQLGLPGERQMCEVMVQMPSACWGIRVDSEMVVKGARRSWQSLLLQRTGAGVEPYCRQLWGDVELLRAGKWIARKAPPEQHERWRLELKGEPAEVALRQGATQAQALQLLQALRDGHLIDKRTSPGRDDKTILGRLVMGTRLETVSIDRRGKGLFSVSVGEGDGIAALLRLSGERVEWLEIGYRVV